jgi:hypothetical protein
MLRSDGNRLIFVGKTGDDVHPACAALHNLISKLGYQDITLDFSEVGYLTPSFMLPLVATARSYRLNKVDFDVVQPVDKKSANLLRNANWLHLISPENFESRDARNRNHLSAIQYLTSAELHSAVDRSMEVILQAIPDIDRSRLKALEWSLNEIMDNVLNHAESPIGGIVQVVTFPTKQLIEFYVCDGGLGIPRTLRSGRPELADDVSAVRAAIEEGVTRNRQTNQGNGLYGTFKCCEVSGGEFDLISGNVSLSHRPGNLHARLTAIPFKGTFVRASINYSFEKLLEKALIFRGRPHDPPSDYVERIYQATTDEIDFKVAQQINAFGSREAGRAARTKIENLMDRGRNSIQFDFEGVHLISSSFADEVFGKLFTTLGPISFGHLCRFVNLDDTVKKLVDRAISQRMGQATTTQ